MIKVGLLRITECHDRNIPAIAWLHVVDLERFQISLFYSESVKGSGIDVWILRASALGRVFSLAPPPMRARGGLLYPLVVVCHNDSEVDAALDNHAAAIVLAYDAPWQVIAAIHSAADHRLFVSPSILHRYHDRVVDVLRASSCDAVTDLTDREASVLTYIAQGLTNKQIARQLHITKATVGSHVLRILRELRAANRTEAAAIAHKAGFTSGMVSGSHDTKHTIDNRTNEKKKLDDITDTPAS